MSTASGKTDYTHPAASLWQRLLHAFGRNRKPLTEEARLAAIFDSSDDAIFTKTLDGIVVTWNAGAERMFGYRREEILGRPVTLLFPHDRLDEEMAMMARIRRGARAENVETVRRRKDGTILDVSVGISPVYDGDGRVVGAATIARDISARRRAEKQLREQAELLDLTDDAVLVWSWEGPIEYWNEGARRLYGFTAEEALGRSNHALLRTQFPENAATIQATLARAGRWEGELEHITKDGCRVVVSARLVLVTHGERRRVLECNRDITQQKQAESALRASHDRLKKVLEVQTVGVMFWDLTTSRLVDANDTFLRLMGYTRDDVAAHELTWQKLTPLEYYDVSMAEIHKFQATGRVGPYEKEYLRKDGTRLWLIFAGSALGENACVEFCVDISDRKNAESALRFSEARFRALYEYATDGMLLTAPDGRVFSANPAACRMLGRTEQQIRDAGRDHLVVTTDPRLALLLGERARTGHATGELTLVRGDGSLLEVEVSSVMFQTDEGLRTSMILHDISDRISRERQIRAQAELLDKAAEGIVASDLDGRITFWSRGAERLFGSTAAEMLGQPLARALARGAATPDAEILSALQRDSDWRGEIHGHDHSGEPLAIEISITVLRDHLGQPAGRLCISTDIREKKQLQEKFLRAQRLESIGMLAAGIAHDLNNILAPISMAAPMLRSSVNAPRDHRLLDTLETCAGRGAGLVRQILGFVHGIGGEPRVVQLKHLLRDVGSVIHETFPRSIMLEEHVPAELWPVNANPTQIHQVVLNLCVNARDAMPGGGTLRLRAENCLLDAETTRALVTDGRVFEPKPGAWLVLTVEDTGTGIPPEVLAHIWEPFFTTKPAGRGTGLGLSTVRGIVETHHGFITLVTAPDRGTAFRVYLPAAEQAAMDPAATGTSVTTVGRGERILLVDDEALIRDTAVAVLTRAGYSVTTAADGADAIARFAAGDLAFALVITDQDMPNLDGATFARMVRAYKPETRILSISGIPDRTTSDEPGAGTNAFLPKPFTADALLGAVAQLLRHVSPSS